MQHESKYRARIIKGNQVQEGRQLDEGDLVRLEDDYQRSMTKEG